MQTLQYLHHSEMKANHNVNDTVKDPRGKRREMGNKIEKNMP